MSPRAAKRLAATLTATAGVFVLLAYVENDRIVFDGGPFGPHSLAIDVSTSERVTAHWQGYAEQAAASVNRMHYVVREATSARLGRVWRVWCVPAAGDFADARQVAEFTFKQDADRYSADCNRAAANLYARTAKPTAPAPLRCDTVDGCTHSAECECRPDSPGTVSCSHPNR